MTGLLAELEGIKDQTIKAVSIMAVWKVGKLDGVLETHEWEGMIFEKRSTKEGLVGLRRAEGREKEGCR